MKQCPQQKRQPVLHAAREARGRVVRSRCCAEQASSTVAATLDTTTLNPHNPVALQSFTFTDESQIELSYLRAQVDELSGLRDALIRKSPAEQVLCCAAVGFRCSIATPPAMASRPRRLAGQLTPSEACRWPSCGRTAGCKPAGMTFGVFFVHYCIAAKQCPRVVLHQRRCVLAQCEVL